MAVGMVYVNLGEISTQVLVFPSLLSNFLPPPLPILYNTYTIGLDMIELNTN